MVSIIANPSVTLPPGELIYNKIGLFLSSACKYNNCDITNADIFLSIYPEIRIILSLSKREKIS
jgi:hypothetical protein